MTVALDPIKLLRTARVDVRNRESISSKILLSSLAQVLLEKQSIATVAAEGCVCNVSDEGHQPDKEVYHNVVHHLGFEA
jgi:hypothetical protein